MATIVVGAPGTVAEVLGWNSIQPWRADYLIACNQLTATRAGAALDLKTKGASTSLRRDDKLTVDVPPPAPCPNQAVAASAFRDYAMVTAPLSNLDVHIPRLREFYDRRAQTIRLAPRSDSIKEFVELLKQDPAVVGPIRDLHLGTHAAAAGSIATKATPGDRAHTQYERLEELVTSKDIAIDAALLQPRPKDGQKDVPARFVIRGCAVGAALPYLRKLKEALGGALEVVAPRYEHAIGEVKGANTHLLYEFLAYEIFLNRPKPLANDREIADAFFAQGLKHYDGTPIEAKTWNSWIPAGSPPPNWNRHLEFLSKAANRKLTGMAFFSTETQPFIQDPYRVKLGFDPGTDAARKVALGTAIYSYDKRFGEKHPWPGSVRLGYKSLSEMIDGFTWSFQWDSQNEELLCRGKRTTYTVHQPIVDVSTQLLIHNVFPIRPAGTPTIEFTDADARFFATTP